MATQGDFINDPFLCFTSAFTESKTLCHMKFKKDETFSLTVKHTGISKWTKFNRAVFSCCVRVTGGNVGILKKICDLSTVFVGPILVFDNGMSPVHCQSAGVDRLERLTIVRDTSDIINNLPQSHPLSGDERVLLRQTLFERRRRLFPEADAPPPQQQAEQAYADLFVEAFIERRFIDAPPQEMWANPSGVFMQMVMFPQGSAAHHDDTNDDFARAQTASMEEHARERERRAASNLENPRPTRRQRTRQSNTTRQAKPTPTRKLPQEWPSILKEARPAESGDCVCLTCVDMAATICFVPCGHQVMCDNCVKKMWEMSGVQRKCPMCNAVPDSIVRPVTTERK